MVLYVAPIILMFAAFFDGYKPWQGSNELPFKAPGIPGSGFQKPEQLGTCRRLYWCWA
jgi:hypothetical protein